MFWISWRVIWMRGSRRHMLVFRKPHLGMQQIMSACHFTVGGFVMAVEVIDDLHDLHWISSRAPLSRN